jgi:hypothetical protein
MIWYMYVWYDMIWYDKIWYDRIWYGMIWYDMMWYDMIWYGMIWHDIFVNCNWVATPWQLYNTHLHTNNTQNDTKQTIHSTTQNLRIQKFENNTIMTVHKLETCNYVYKRKQSVLLTNSYVCFQLSISVVWGRAGFGYFNWRNLQLKHALLLISFSKYCC